MAAIINVDFQNGFIFFLLGLFSLLCYSLFFRKTSSKREAYDYDLPPSPPSLPIIGHLHLILSSLVHKSFHKISSNYGPLLHLRVFNVPIVLASSASVAYDIFRLHDVNVSSRGPPPFEESVLLGSTSFISAPYGDYFKFTKKLLMTKLLGPQALERSRLIRVNEVEKFYKNMVDKAMKKETVEINKEAMKLSNNSICKMIMGRGCLEEEGESERVRDLIIESFYLAKKFFLAAILRWLLEKLGISLFKKEIMNVSRKFDELLEKLLREHEENPDNNEDTDMMDALLAASRDENAEYKITRTQIKAFLVDMFIAGTDITALSTQGTMAEIINNPNILVKIREEIDAIVGKSRLIQETDLPNLPYLQAVVKEGLRLHPPTPFMVREFEEECKIKGFYIPASTKLVVNGYAVMRDPNVWEDPEEFRPERFLASAKFGKEEEIREQALKYIAFGSGRRGCPGANIAYIFVGTAIGVMMQYFDWEIKGDKVDMEEAIGGLNLTLAHPLKCTPVVRTHLTL